MRPFPRNEDGFCQKTVLKTTTLLGFSTFISFILGYIRDMIMVAKFGATTSTDAWIAASTVTDLVYKFLFLGTLGSVFIPTFIKYLEFKELLHKS